MLPDTEPRLFRRLFLDTLYRGPTPRETRSFRPAPTDRVVSHLLRRREMFEQWVEAELFYFLLLDRFRPANEAVSDLTERLAGGQGSVRDATAEILLSSGFSLRNPGNDTFVTVLLEQCLGFEVQSRKHAKTLEAGKKIYDGEAGDFLDQEARTQADLVRIVLDRREFTALTLDRHHRRLFEAPLLGEDRRGNPTEDEAATALIDRVHADWSEFFPVLGDWLTSESYASSVEEARPKTDRQFVRSIFSDLCSRQPDYQELRNVRNAMQSMADSSPLRSVIATVLLNSDEADLPDLSAGEEAEFVATCFERYLGREPSDQERQTFVSSIKEGRANRDLVVRTLVTSSEYQTY
ncbi:MAG: hypothetical protein AAF196_04590 [Planctomycetota bacterium]